MDTNKERSLEMIMFGDGLSGKTTLLKAIAMEIALNEYHLYLAQRGSAKGETFESQSIEHVMLQDQEFLELLQKENPSLHEYLFKDVTMGTLGVETINFKWKVQNNQVIHLKGYDLGGQNIYDHLRSILAGLATPKTRMIAVFDMSRRMSCENSLKQIQDQLMHNKSTSFTENSLIFVFNKKDLHQFLKSNEFQEPFREELLNELKMLQERELKLELPSILSNDQIISVTIPKGSVIGFECLEAIVYDVLKRQLIPRHQNIMTDANARALAREVALHFLMEYRAASSSQSGITVRPLDELKRILFSERPLAVQYAGNLVIDPDKKHLKLKDLLTILRMKFEGFEIDAQTVTSESIKKILNHVVNVEVIRHQVEKLSKNRTLETSALHRQGIKELLKYLLEDGNQFSRRPQPKVLHRLSS